MLLLQNPGKQQRMAVLSARNLLFLLSDNLDLFCKTVLPLLNEQIKILKDQDTILQLCATLEKIVDLQVVSASYLLTVLDTVIEHLRMFNKKQKDVIWNSLIVKILSYTQSDAYVELALDFADPLNNKSTHRIAATIFKTLSHLIPQKDYSTVL